MKVMTTTVLSLVGVAGLVLAADAPSVMVRPASLLKLPGVGSTSDYVADCNSPLHWTGGTLYVFASCYGGQPWRSEGADLFSLTSPQSVAYDNQEGYNGGRWIEATFRDSDGKLYGWYHREPRGVCGEERPLTAPQIGAAVSTDDGMHWRDLGIVLKAPADSLYRETPNLYFAGGNGDFSVMLDRTRRYFYFLIGTYNKDKAEQGVSIARMRYTDRDAPVGKVVKWYKGAWSEPGLGGRVSPIFPAAASWHEPEVDAFWGPSIHRNTHLNQYVVLLNRAKDKNWTQEGIYVTFNPDLSDPSGWSKPVKILDAPELEASKWYPQVIGIDAGRAETDKLSGQIARLFVAGISKWELVFLRPGESSPASRPTGK